MRIGSCSICINNNNIIYDKEKYREMIDGDGKMDKSPSLHWPIPNIVLGSGIEQKPVLIKIEYKIDPTKKREFERIMKEWSRIRKRDGALHLGL